MPRVRRVRVAAVLLARTLAACAENPTDTGGGLARRPPIGTVY